MQTSFTIAETRKRAGDIHVAPYQSNDGLG
jgi:hypothetical protein